MAETTTLYLDACFFLSLFDPDCASRHPAIKQVIDAARDRQCKIITSMVSITEVAYGALEKAGGDLDQNVLDDINTYWHPESPVKLVEVGQLLTYAARDLQREALQRGIGRVGSIDAIHLATAKAEKVNKFLTYDGRISKYAPLVPFSIEEPRYQLSEDGQSELFQSENQRS